MAAAVSCFRSVVMADLLRQVDAAAILARARSPAVLGFPANPTGQHVSAMRERAQVAGQLRVRRVRSGALARNLATRAVRCSERGGCPPIAGSSERENLNRDSAR